MMNIFHGPLKIFSHLSLAWPSDAMISKQSADSQKINAAKYYKRGETIEQYVEVRLRRKKWRHPITLTHTHNVHSAWILLIALLRKLRSILISQLSAETKTLSKKNWEICTSWWLKYTRGKVVPAELQSKVWFLQKSTWNKSHFNN